MRLQMLAEFPETITSEALASIEAEVAGAIERLRSMLFELRPAALDREGLSPRAASLRRPACEDRRLGSGGRRSDGVPPDADLAALLYRIAQEAIVNVAKHAGATRAARGGQLGRRRPDAPRGRRRGRVHARPRCAAGSRSPRRSHDGRTAELAGGWARIVSARPRARPSSAGCRSTRRRATPRSPD
jgi:hypothetical protein